MLREIDNQGLDALCDQPGCHAAVYISLVHITDGFRVPTPDEANDMLANSGWRCEPSLVSDKTFHYCPDCANLRPCSMCAAWVHQDALLRGCCSPKCYSRFWTEEHQ